MARGSGTADSVSINGVEVAPGARATIDLPLPGLYTHTQLNLPVRVVCGRRPGPRLLVTGAVHGDEINGVEIIRRLLAMPLLRRLRGALITVPVVNIYGFIAHSRYLPDRRDLNRSFPGSETGSLTGRLADQLIDKIVSAASPRGRPAHRRDPPQQPAADPGRSERTGNPRAGARFRHAGGVGQRTDGGFAAPGRRHTDAGLRGRRGAALRRTGHPRRGCEGWSR